MQNGALSGLKIVELGHLVSGPYCAKLLADLGAEVIKVEEPGVGDEARRREPFLHDKADPERSGLFLYLNTNKLGVTLSLKSKTGREILHKLVKEADVLVENNPPSIMEECGLQYESLKGINPRLIMTSITPFGQSGPYRDYKATELISYHIGGLGYITPPVVEAVEQYPPLKAGGQLADFCTGTTAAVATMVAVFYREATGLGQQVDVSEQEAVASFFRSAFSAYSYTKTTQGRSREARRPAGVERILACSNGYISFAPIQEDHWQRLLEMIGGSELAQDERFKDAAGRREHGEELTRVIGEWTRQHTKEEVADLIQGADFPGVPVQDVNEAVDWDHFAARDFFVDIDHPKVGKLRYPRGPYVFSKTPWRASRPAPLLGQHNEDIYCGRLGYSKEQLIRLRSAGVI